MGTRHASRKLAMQVLYQSLTRSQDLIDFIEPFIDESEFDQDVKIFGKELALGSWTYRQTADDFVSQYAIGWTIERISLVDLSILRLAFYELMKSEIPGRVVLNEAVELAKEFSADESPKFINGILGKFVESDVYRNR